MRPNFPLLIVTVVLTLGAQMRVVRAEGTPDELTRARVLDREGVRAYREGRYNDAIRYFSEALRLGGPPSELWNIAKCHLRLDEPEQASDEIQRYLGQSGLSAEDRAEASSQLQELQRRRSTLTVSSSPSGASVYLDGRREAVGSTPLSVDLAHGTHSIGVEATGYRPYTTQVEARFGRAVIVDAPLTRGDTPVPPPPRKSGALPLSSEKEHALTFTVGAQMGAFIPHLGSRGEAVRAGAALSASYYLHASADTLVGIGARVFFSGDSWSNAIGAPLSAVNCGGTIPADESATEVSVFGTGSFAYRITPRLRIGGDLGLGFATYFADEVGGDVFMATCQPSFGVKPALHVGAEVSYSITPLLRVVAAPALLELHPAFDGARSVPIDTSGLWLRFGMGLGLAVDL